MNEFFSFRKPSSANFEYASKWLTGIVKSVLPLLAVLPAIAGAQVPELSGIPQTSIEPGVALIGGEVELTGCSELAENKINDAMAIVLDRLEDAAYLGCLKDAIMTDTNGLRAEKVLSRLKDKMPTKITCKQVVCGNPTILGCAGISDGEENFTLQTAHAHSSPAVEIAATIVHEVVHRKGLGHPGNTSALDYPFTVPVQAGTCIQNMVADGLDRRDAPGDTDLAPVGGTGGGVFERRCGPKDFVRGFTVFSSNFVNEIIIECDSGFLSPIGSEMDSDRQMVRQCQSDEHAIAIRAQTNAVVNYLAMACAKTNAIEADIEKPPVTWRYLGGAGGGDEGGLRVCPAGMAIKGFHGRSGARVDELRVLCEDIDGFVQPTPTQLEVAGSADGASKLGYCIGRGVMAALYGQSGGSIDRLGGSCFPTRKQPNLIGNDGAPELIVGNSTRHVFDWNGGNGGTPFSLECSDGQALVGVDLRIGEGVDAIRGICDTPSVGISTSQVRTAWTGRRTGAVVSRTCAQGSFLVGLKTFAKKSVHATPTLQGVAPICRKINYLPGSVAVGGTGTASQ